LLSLCRFALHLSGHIHHARIDINHWFCPKMGCRKIASETSLI